MPAAEQRSREVRSMFARIVPRYDLMNRLMTGGQDVRWRREVARLAQPAGSTALDIATGTGDVAIELRKQGARSVVGADFCEPMLVAASTKLHTLDTGGIRLVAADALSLPFEDRAFDIVTSAFLLRNVADLPGCLFEMRRVLRPGGRAVALELTHLRRGARRAAFSFYFDRIVPWLGGLVSGDRAAYQYLPASLGPFPDAEALAELFRCAGFSSVGYKRVGAGTLAIHIATTAME
jgi:demethylmenaquinone methyltransferase/2-methoxy-6-polyprenyl-1,4-benzoquinol methylase